MSRTSPSSPIGSLTAQHASGAAVFAACLITVAGLTSLAAGLLAPITGRETSAQTSIVLGTVVTLLGALALWGAVLFRRAHVRAVEADEMRAVMTDLVNEIRNDAEDDGRQ